MTESSFYVYGYFKPGCGEPFYIGKGRGKRCYDHLCTSYRKRKTHFYNTLNKLLKNGIEPNIEILYRDLDEQEAFRIEKELIASYGRLDLGTGCLTNHTDGGQGSSSLVKSPETLAKLSASLKGRKFSPERVAKMRRRCPAHVAAKMSATKRSRPQSAKAIASRSARKGFKHTAETK
jgi:hypothetical protein